MENLATQDSENGSSKADDRTPFEKRYADLKAAKAVVREKHSEVTKLANQIVDLKRKAAKADTAHKRAMHNVDTIKDGLKELFDSDMRNY